MKKKILVLLVSVVMILAMVGCDSQGVGILLRIKEVAEWEGIEGKSVLALTAEYESECVTINTTIESYSNKKDSQIEAIVTIDSLEYMGQNIDLTTGEYKLSPIKLYMDGMKVYMNSSIINEVSRMATSDVLNIQEDKDYISFDLTDTLAASELTKEEVTNLGFTILTNSNVKLPLTRKANVYSLKLKDSDLVDIIAELFCEIYKINSDNLIDGYKLDGNTDKLIQESIAQTKNIDMEKMKEEMKDFIAPIIAGSSIDTSYTFNPTNYLSDSKIDIKVTTKDENGHLVITKQTEYKKANKKTINFPSNARVYTQEELELLF